MEYLEHEKLKNLKEDTQSYGYFLEWLIRRYTICSYYEKGELYYPEHIDIERTLAEYFGIDYNKLMKEKEEMLKEIRLENSKNKTI